jgi:hypothetical protein
MLITGMYIPVYSDEVSEIKLIMSTKGNIPGKGVSLGDTYFKKLGLEVFFLGGGGGVCIKNEKFFKGFFFF